MTDNNSLELMPSFGIEKFTDNCLRDVTHILSQAQTQGYRAVNTVMIQAYWLVGARIVLEEQHGNKRAGYGDKLIERLSKALSQKLGSGMSVAQLKNCRQFYYAFPSFQKSYTLCSQLSWSHLRLIMRLDTEGELRG